MVACNVVTLGAMLNVMSFCRKHEPDASFVLTNGIFDVLHCGHARYLDEAARLGKYLIVAVNDDAVTRQLKGPTRPINTLEDRMYLVSRLSSVAYVMPLNALRVAELIRELKPDIWVKGGDYTLESLDRSEVAAANEVGVQIRILPVSVGYSTTHTLERLQKR